MSETRLHPPPLVIGVGQPWRGDDAAGLAALTLLEGGPWECRAHHGEGLSLMALWEDRQAVVIVDAARSGVAPGTLHRVEVGGALPLEAGRWRASSHGFGLAEAVETALVLGCRPRLLVIHAVEGACWDLGAGLSPAVAEALPRLATAVQNELSASQQTRDGPS